MRVLNVNDHGPAFRSAQYRFDVVENMAAGTTVGQVVATDGDGDIVTFSLSSQAEGTLIPVFLEMCCCPENIGALFIHFASHFAETFTIEEETGVIRTVRPLDYEATDTFTFSVTARDAFNSSGAAQRNTRDANVLVTVVVLDVNDNVPTFSSDVYHADVEEGTLQRNLVQVH